ncbi:MAG: class I SAM-dependent methyltransferase [Dysgonamonadaceae bacterium]|jgi:ubiquinone/menaquinone biosynthesis C-methylase UbiE|nr:class I SAM-dependent methyltransferase [Dysgonamonadaceae bacterium]
MKLLTKYISKQFANPSGVGGRTVASVMNQQNRKQYQAVLDNINIQPTDTILDIGFGNGYLIGNLLKHHPAKICGIEISRDMLTLVSRKHRQDVSMEKLDLHLADIKALPFDDAYFDKICTVNTLYFWNNADRSFAEIERTLKPGGISLNVFYSKDFLDNMAHAQYGYSKYSIEQVVKMTEKSGLKVVRVIEIQTEMSYCVIAKKE